MSDHNNINAKQAPPTPIMPADKLPLMPSEKDMAAVEKAFSGGSGELSQTPWAKMFPAGATKEQLNAFIQNYIKSLITQIKHDDKVHKENLEKRRQEEQGN